MQLSANQNLILIEGAATYERILSHIHEVESDEAIRHLQDFLKIYPEFAKAHNDLAVLYYKAGNSLKALAHYEKSHKLEPANITFRKNLADFYFVELEWSEDAVHTYLDILKDNPFDIEALNTLGSISLKLGRKEQSRLYFSRTLQLDSNNQEAKLALQQLPTPVISSTEAKQLPGDTYSDYRKPEPVAPAAAQSSFQNMFRIAEPEAMPITPATLSFQNTYSSSAQKSERTIEELYREAVSLAKAGSADEAIRLLEQLLKQDIGHAVAHNDLGVLYQQKGELQLSRSHHEEAVRLKPANSVFKKNLADLLCVGFNDLQEALKIYVQLQAKSPQDVEVLKAIAHICIEVDKPVDARFFLERILALQPWDRDAQYVLKAMEKANADKEAK